MTTQNVSSATVAQALKAAYEQLWKLAGDDLLFRKTIFTAFGEGADASVFQSAWTNHDFSSFPEIKICSKTEINGANGAFASATDRIYLAQEFIDKNANNLDSIVAVLLEEYGHFIDSQINTTDAAGDEGDIFARLIQGRQISPKELVVLQAEDDTATVTLNNQVVEIEMNVDGAHKSGFWWLDNAGNGNGNIQGSNEDEWIGGWGGNDVIKGGGGNDLIRGEEGDDELHGQGGWDTLEGGDGKDNIYGDDDIDFLSGGNGDDTLDGGNSDDKVDGNDGDDLIVGGDGRDEINGGNGWDIVDYASVLPVDTLIDTLQQRKTGISNSEENRSFRRVFKNGIGYDTLDDIEEIRGTKKYDSLYTSPVVGIKRLEGDEGNDNLYAISALDSGFGVKNASNQLFGENGNDILYADVAKDGYAQYLTGGAGKDIFVMGSLKKGSDAALTAQNVVDFLIGTFSGTRSNKLINPFTSIAAGASVIKDIFWTDTPSGLTSDVVVIDDFKVDEDILILPDIDDSLTTGERYTFEPYEQQGQNGKGFVTIVAHRDSVLFEEIVRIASDDPKKLAEKLQSDWVKGNNSGADINIPHGWELKADSRNKIVGGYYPEWGTYGRNFQVADVPADKLTHLFYAFAQIDQNGKVALFDPWASKDKPFPGDVPSQELKGNLNQLRILKERNPNLKNMLSIGGWSLSGPFSTVASTPESRQAFAKSAVELMTKYRTSDGKPIFDGLDIDWEYPIGGGPSEDVVNALAPSRANKEVGNSPADKQNYVLLLEALRQELDKQGSDYQLTIASAAGSTIINNFDLKGISQYVDFFNVMSYDFHGSTWEPNQTNHQAALYGSDSNDVDSAIQAYIKEADSDPNDSFTRSDIVMGAPLYGRAWVGVPSTNDGLLQPANGTASGTWEPGIFDYKDLHNRLQIQPGSYKEVWDNTAKVPYIYSPTEGGMFSTYENVRSIGAKADYIRYEGLGGMFFWELSGDLPSSHPDSLVSKAASALGVAP